ncbi:MAG TPA: hypothetical protein VIK13_15745 [Candidatus Limnocylindrales bacterium]
MSRAIALAGIIGLVLLVGALFLASAAPSSPRSMVLLAVAVILLIAVVLAVFGNVWRTPGSYRVTPRDKKR